MTILGALSHRTAAEWVPQPGISGSGELRRPLGCWEWRGPALMQPWVWLMRGLDCLVPASDASGFARRGISVIVHPARWL